ncbi:MAG: PhnD/SsuA/transferrin family substrate-binding protein [Gammaproteobacteria bacterium]|nr:PhnD/SsuA/transferrin family substrate-binding protein [Gammaproteobacteria bacterium]MCF6363140.1 PhnD/SsuA/transferrin family substrate-binding protein [Gammaproteobacteria bacterium]
MDNPQRIANRQRPPPAWRLISGLALCLLLVSTQIHSGHDARQSHPFIVSGVVLSSDAALHIEDFAKLLGKAAGYPLRVRFVDSYNALSTALREDPSAIGWTCGAAFVEDRIRDGQQLVSIPLFRGQPTYHSLIITRRGRTEASLLDFKGQILAYSDGRSNSGYVVPAYQLKQAGFAIRNYFRLLLHTGNHERSIEAVANGLADVAAVDEYVWVEYLKMHPGIANELHEIERFGPFPFTLVVAGKAVDRHTLERLQQTLSGLAQSPGGKKLLDSFGIDGFVKKENDFYRPIEDMMRTLGWPQEDPQ